MDYYNCSNQSNDGISSKDEVDAELSYRLDSGLDSLQEHSDRYNSDRLESYGNLSMTSINEGSSQTTNYDTKDIKSYEGKIFIQDLFVELLC